MANKSSKKQAAPKGAPKAEAPKAEVPKAEAPKAKAPKTEEVKKGGGMFPAYGCHETFRLREIKRCHLLANSCRRLCAASHMQGDAFR